MLIGGDDISKDVIILGTSFSTFVYIRVRFRFALIGAKFFGYKRVYIFVAVCFVGLFNGRSVGYNNVAQDRVVFNCDSIPLFEECHFGPV